MIYIKFIGECGLSKGTISKWMKRFIEGRETVKDDDRSGCPLNVSTEINVSEVEKYVMKDRRVTIREIANDLSMSYGTVQEILTSKLNMR